MNKMGLVLQGGGALGAYEYGAVTRLIELQWQPVLVTGVSIGAINAAAIAGARGGDIRTSLALQLHFIRTSESISQHDSGGDRWLAHR
jgi:predicted acylesterase/phospholipase RssA